MCVDIRKQCVCGRESVRLHLRDNVMIPEVIQRIFCPQCPGDVPFDEESMIDDNGWVIEYDMDLARGLAATKLQLDPEEVTPAFVFDEGYACWLELYPGEQAEIEAERAEIMRLLEVSRKAYLEAIQRWNIERVARLKEAGWRRAQHT